MTDSSTGTVYLVGAGPGDPGLLTLRARELLRSVDAVLPDGLVSEEVLALVDGPELIPVGKRYGSTSTTQAEIDALVINLARDGKSVCRLKGGDPMVFGRAGEEMRSLADAGIPYEIVPGVTSATAAAAYAGIPLTLRGVTAGFVCVTGHRASADDSPDTDWAALAKLNQTLVILMVATRIDPIAEALLDAGLAPTTPSAIVENASLPGQRTIISPLGDIAARSRVSGIRTPAILIVGEAVAHSHDLQWVPIRPLAGRRVLLTTPPPATAELRSLLGAAGASVIALPTIQVEPLADQTLLASTLKDELNEFQWAVFASRSGVEAVFRTLNELNLDARAFGGIQIAALGTGTARALHAHGITADLLPEKFVSESVVASLLERLQHDDNVLVFGAVGGRTVIRDRLLEAGISVTRLDAYRTIPAPLPADLLQYTLEHPPDWVVFTSPSAVKSLFGALDRASISLPSTTRLACIGPITATAIEARGLTVSAIAEPHTYAGLVTALVNFPASGDNQ
jgi:uroporphyrinogen III methyltransferase/synthase